MTSQAGTGGALLHLDNRLLVTSAPKWQDLERLKNLLKKGANPNRRVKYHADGAPALHQWALMAQVEAVQLLLAEHKIGA